MNYNQVIKYVNNREKLGTKLGLSRIKEILKKLGNPEKKLKIIHVAGTNGKGSVCAMLSSILQKAGYKAGMYTSPHLVKLNERFKINRKNISDKDLVKYFLKIKPFIRNQTYYEITTALALQYFKEKKVDFAILEVGLGGRLDATNVVTPLVSAITNVSLEHTDYLGKALNKIAYEKAGIIKKDVPVVTAAKGSALKIIKRICEEKKSKLYIIKKTNQKIKLSLKGDFQLKNAAVALEIINVLKKQHKTKINKTDIKNGLKNTKWPGRFQFIEKNTLLDCAHNPDGTKALRYEIRKIRNKYNRIILVIGILKDKEIGKIINEIVPLANIVIITKINDSRAAEPILITNYIKKYNKNYKIIKNSKKAFKYAKSIAKKNDLILITGSSYLIGEFFK